VQLNREQMISVGVLCALLLMCAFAVGSSLQTRSEAANELAQRREVLANLQARLRTGPNGGLRSAASAPAAAFLEAGTSGLAAAQLQAHLLQAAAAHNATMISYGVEPARREDSPDLLRVQVTLDVSQKALQGLLYQLEIRTPYVFVELMTVQPGGTAALRTSEDPALRLTLGLRAFWRKGTA
jgi:general secretion pathway protein M